MNYPCHEATIDLSFPNFVIRLWIDITTDKAKEEYEPLEIIKKIRAIKEVKRELIIEKIATIIPNINAVQIMDKEGEEKLGEVAYTVDFVDDAHG